MDSKNNNSQSMNDSILKAKRYLLDLKTKQSTDHIISSGKLKLRKMLEDDLLKNMKLDEESIAIEVMKGLSVVDACTKLYGSNYVETWKSGSSDSRGVVS